MALFSDLIGKTILITQGVDTCSEEVYFQCADGTIYKMHHYQSCCESVFLEDIVGDSEDLCGVVRDARVYTQDDDSSPDACFTFYIIQTDKGAVTLRWFGSSNGYYSIDVSFEEVNEMPFVRLNLKRSSAPQLVAEFRRMRKLQVIWRLTHNGCEHGEYYDYLIRLGEELTNRNITIHDPENQDEPEPPEGDPSSAKG